MKLKISFTLVTMQILMLFDGASFGQVVERNGVLYRDFQFRNDSLYSDDIIKRQNKLMTTNEDSLPFIKKDFIVNSFDGDYGADQTDISAAVDGNGNYAFTWLDYRNGRKEIFAQFYNSDDERLGPNFKVSEYPLYGNNSPFIATNNRGDFVIVWMQSFDYIFAQRFTKEGNKVGSTIIVNSFYGYDTKVPSVAVNQDGSFMVMWATNPTYSEENVYARLFDSSGNYQSSEIIVTESGNHITSYGQGKEIAVDGDGNYSIVWSGVTSNYISNIYTQIIDRTGQKIGSNTIINTITDNADCYFPEIVSTDDGHLLIIWYKQLRYQGNNGTSARIYHTDNYFVTDEIQINEPDVWGDGFSISTDRDSTFYIGYYADINPYFRKISKTGNWIGDSVRVNYNSGIEDYSPLGLLTNIYNNHFLMSLQIYKGNDANLYYQKFDIDFTAIGAFNRIHDDVGSSSQRKSFVKFNNNGESIVLWEDQRNGRSDLYAQVYDEEFNPVGNNIQVNETISDYWNVYDKTVGSLSDGTFVIAFSCYENSSDGTSVFLQAINTNGEKIGQNKLIKNKNYYSNHKVAMNINTNDEVLLCWYDVYGADIRIFDKMLNALSGVKTLLKYSNSIGFSPLTVTIDSLFNILVIWTNFNFQSYSSDNNIRGKFFDSKGNGFTEFVIDTVNSYVRDFTCKNKGRNFALIYKDGSMVYLKRIYNLDQKYLFENSFYSYGYDPSQTNIVEFDNLKIFVTYNSYLDVFGFYANDNKSEEKTYLLHQYDFIDPYSDRFNGTNSADIFNDELIFSFESNENHGTGSDIWANVRSIDDINFTAELFYPPTNYDILYNNFPNPFNLKTRIAYQILAYHKVKLTVYDILGMEVKVLVDANQEKGIYEVDFDASGLASGIYFYKLEAFNTTVKKMLLLK